MNNRSQLYYYLCISIAISVAPIEGKSWIQRQRERKRAQLASNSLVNQTPAEFTITMADQPPATIIDTKQTSVTPPPKPVDETPYIKLTPDSASQTSKVKAESVSNSNEKHLIKGDEVEDDFIEFQFENADLDHLIKQIEEIFDISFVPDDTIQPLAQGGKAIKGNKISFKTNKPLLRKEAWNLFVTFLDIAGFSIVPTADTRIYRIKSYESAKKSAIPCFIGIDPSGLPDDEGLIRYVYFIENSTLETMTNIIKVLQSPGSSFVGLQEHKAFILTDKAYNIKTLMSIVKDLDKASVPQAMSVLKLKRADATQVKDLYDTLIKGDDKGIPRAFAARKQPSSIFFPENIQIFAEPRTNALILIGAQDAITKIEEFIVKNVDVELDKPYSPLHVFQLRYADAVTIAEIMTNITQFGKATEAGKSGGVRGIDKYLKEMTFTPEKTTNRIVVKGEYNDYLMAKDIMEKLDEPQPQVAIEVLILTININQAKELGVQMRSKDPGPNSLLGNNIKFQTSGLRRGATPAGIVENTAADRGARRLLGDLAQLALGATAGNTLVTLGADALGVWGMFQVLQTIGKTQVISNPFLIATNKTPAVISVGETRRVQTANVFGGGDQPTQAFGDETAKLEVEITPQINSDGMIVLKLVIKIDEFRNPGATNAEKNIREIKTQTIVADKEVLALGGLIKNTTAHNISKVPILGDVPILGWLFKNKRKSNNDDNLLILISTRIIEPQKEVDVQAFTKERIDTYYIANITEEPSERHDPINRTFFAKDAETREPVDQFLFKRQHKNRALIKEELNKPSQETTESFYPEAPEIASHNTTDEKPTQENAIITTQTAPKKRRHHGLSGFLSQTSEGTAL